MLLCTPRLTSSSPPCSPAAWAAPCSNARPPSRAGSPNTRAKTNAISPATRPASIPRTSSDLTIAACRSVAGEAEQVPTVVDELVQHFAREHRGGSLVEADEVEQGQEDHPAEQRPRGDLAQRDRRGDDTGDRRALGGCLRHGWSSLAIVCSSDELIR